MRTNEQEAEETIKKWYAARREVKEWQVRPIPHACVHDLFVHVNMEMVELDASHLLAYMFWSEGACIAYAV